MSGAFGFGFAGSGDEGLFEVAGDFTELGDAVACGNHLTKECCKHFIGSGGAAADDGFSLGDNNFGVLFQLFADAFSSRRHTFSGQELDFDGAALGEFAGDLLERPHGAKFSASDDGDAVADAGKFGEDMTGDDQGASFGGQPQEDGAHLDASFRIKTVCWFVKDQDFRVMEQSAGNADSLLHPVAEAFNIAVLHPDSVGEFEDFGDAALAFLAGDGKGGAEEIEVLADSHVVIRAELIRHVAYESANFGEFGDTVGTSDASGTGGGTGEADEDADCGCLACSVGTDEPKNTATIERQRQPVKGDEFTVVFGEIPNLDDWFAAGHGLDFLFAGAKGEWGCLVGRAGLGDGGGGVGFEALAFEDDHAAIDGVVVVLFTVSGEIDIISDQRADFNLQVEAAIEGGVSGEIGWDGGVDAAEGIFELANYFEVTRDTAVECDFSGPGTDVELDFGRFELEGAADGWQEEFEESLGGCFESNPFAAGVVIDAAESAGGGFDGPHVHQR